MRYNDHSNLRGTHAELGASQPAWLNYDEQKMRARISNRQAARRGTRIHDWAHEAIKLRLRQKENNVSVNKYINDGIRYQLVPEFMVRYSDLAYGEADCLGYDEKEKILRIHDLKTGLIQAGLTQLEVYAAYFCLEYDLDPEDITILLFIYQNDKIKGGQVDSAKIRKHMKRTIEADGQVRQFYAEGV